ncbi:class I SAM-dependent methyltransferase [Pseudanabaena mucicola]|uniref:Methyltransferase domain-containing protein n=1 Tax=Pseudanabaena mucicola FACHB-723 TaxID=2692860 RepID=A0ABR7ZX95_9CYAN|nr:methyltransferase domain-containing protein [Pseudanabaena mucicola]MBD2188085.1 methyltransferase domain-containing protein [Pseudanabaena mucicola FACHB-723]
MQISNTLASEEYQEIQRLLATLPDKSVSLSQMWQLMDQVWDDLGCDNLILDQEKITAFYKHPVWLLNGFFIEQHEVSLQHRHIIADLIVQLSVKHVLDFGGGFGTLARIIANKSGNIEIDIYEPYPNNFAIEECKDYPLIQFVHNLHKKYDCLVSTDVLEHVTDPLQIFENMIETVSLNGYLIIANCFRPVIKCHLPSTFHFRYTFNLFARLMGLKVLGKCKGKHATIYQKIHKRPTNWKIIRTIEYLSQKTYFYILRHLHK